MEGNGLQPHRIKSFKLSNDLQFAKKLIDVVGLYLNPPEHAIVLCVDKKSQIQALDRTQKSLPIYPGRLRTMTHDHVVRRTQCGGRDRDRSLYVAASASGVDQASQHHRRLDRSDGSIALGGRQLCDAQAPKVRRWLARHPRFHMHFTPTSSSWLNPVERWFRELTQKRLKRGTFTGVRQPKAAIFEYVDQHNDRSQGYRWQALPDEILAKIRRARAVLDNSPTN